MTEYDEFLDSKRQYGAESGFEPSTVPEWLFPFQRSLVDWAIRKGRGALFADTGLGKTPMQLVWADNVARHTGKRVLLMTPLAVGAQTVREAAKFGIDASKSMESRIVVTNYERLHHFNAADFGGAVCDESSAIKAFDGKRRSEVTEFMRTLPYRLLATATAAPNDYVELGTSSEALGVMGQLDMLSRFFKNDNNTSDTGRMHGKTQRWRFKGHAEKPFWRWVCSWARACRKPSDLGFDDGAFLLPPLIEREHIVETRTKAEGMLFALPARNFREERDERRRTIQERCEMVADLVSHDRPAVIWCHLNAEGDLLERLIPGAVQVKGADSEERKEEVYEAFARGDVLKLVTKPVIGAWGLNWQHCRHVVTFASHSFEQFYQSVRRCWRFGQTGEVVVDIVAAEGEVGVRDNLRRKSKAADIMFSHLVAFMADAMKVTDETRYDRRIEVPSWV